jgi:hypothetical protein
MVLAGLLVGACSFDTSGSGGDGGLGPRDGDVGRDGGALGDDCAEHDDCAEGVCELAAGICVECVADDDCAGVCDTEANRCLECRDDVDCGDGRVCGEGNQCIDDPGRPAICNGVEVDLNSDAAHCGACDNVCGTGTSGVCTRGHCESASPCDPSETTEFGAGDGTSEDPYLICSAAQLELLSGTEDSAYLESHFLVTAHVDLEGALWQPIGPGEVFAGRFDGNHYRLSNLSIEVSSPRSGFFARIGQDGHVLNVLLEGVEAEGDEDESGLLVGFNEGTIEHAIASGSIRGAEHVGGLVGRNDGDIRACLAEVETAGDAFVGGLIGSCGGGTVTDSIARGSVEGGLEVGGLIGRAESDCLISGGRAEGDVSSHAATVGGLIGVLQDSAEVRRSAATGSVVLEGEGAEAGGLIGRMHSSGTAVNESFASGDVTAPDADDVGGLIGHVRREAEIRDSYAAGDVEGDVNVGGLIGRVDRSGTTIERTYAVGLVVGNEIGGLVGNNESNGNVALSYWWFDPEVNDEQPSSSAGGESLTTSEFADPDNFEDWDFDERWRIQGGQRGPVSRRPVLQWQLQVPAR